LRLLIGLGVLGALLLAVIGSYVARSYFAPQGISNGGPPIVSASATPSSLATTALAATAVPTTLGVATSTPVAADCRSISQFVTAPPASSVASDNGYAPPTTPTIPFPTYAPGFLYSTFTDPSPTNPQDVYHFIRISACAPTTNVAALQAFYASAMINNGWSQSGNFPYGGDYSRLCGDSYCWNWGPPGGDINRFVSLESVQQVGSAVTYQLRLGTEQYY